LVGDLEFAQDFSSAENDTSPGQIQLLELTTGANTISVPDDTVAAVVIPPVINTETITLKGISGDTGVSLHPSNPSLIGLNAVSSFVLTVGGDVTVRIIFV